MNGKTVHCKYHVVQDYLESFSYQYFLDNYEFLSNNPNYYLCPYQIYTISQLLTFDNFERAEFIDKFYSIYHGRNFVDTINDYYFHRFSVLDEVNLLRRYEKLCSDYVVLDKILCSYLRRLDYNFFCCSNSLFHTRS